MVASLGLYNSTQESGNSWMSSKIVSTLDCMISLIFNVCADALPHKSVATNSVINFMLVMIILKCACKVIK